MYEERRKNRSDSLFFCGREYLLLHLSLFISDELLPLDVREALFLHLSLFREDELVSSRFWSRVTTTPHLPPRSISLFMERGGGVEVIRSSFVVENIFFSILLFL
jgi:hypothetical protein